MNRVLILSDKKPGHENQSLALCQRLGFSHTIVPVRYPTRIAKALSYPLDRMGIRTRRLFRIAPPLPDAAQYDIICSAGSTTYYPARVLAAKTGKPHVAILYPRGYRTDCTAILCPETDDPPNHPHIIPLPISLCAADPEFFDQRTREFKNRHPAHRPSTGFIIGGPNAVTTIHPETLRVQLDQAFAASNDHERWVTTSRRTPPEIEALIESLPFDYRLIASRDPFNPIPAFIQLCDRLYLTDDSASMISECVSFGESAVEILPTTPLRSPNKFQRLITSLEEQGALHRFDGTPGNARRKVDITPLIEQRLRPLLPH